MVAALTVHRGTVGPGERALHRGVVQADPAVARVAHRVAGVHHVEVVGVGVHARQVPAAGHAGILGGGLRQRDADAVVDVDLQRAVRRQARQRTRSALHGAGPGSR
jgi:hypothetical protein